MKFCQRAVLIFTCGWLMVMVTWLIMHLQKHQLFTSQDEVWLTPWNVWKLLSIGKECACKRFSLFHLCFLWLLKCQGLYCLRSCNMASLASFSLWHLYLSAHCTLPNVKMSISPDHTVCLCSCKTRFSWKAYDIQTKSYTLKSWSWCFMMKKKRAILTILVICATWYEF